MKKVQMVLANRLFNNDLQHKFSRNTFYLAEISEIVDCYLLETDTIKVYSFRELSLEEQEKYTILGSVEYVELCIKLFQMYASDFKINEEYVNDLFLRENNMLRFNAQYGNIENKIWADYGGNIATLSFEQMKSLKLIDVPKDNSFDFLESIKSENRLLFIE